MTLNMTVSITAKPYSKSESIVFILIQDMIIRKTLRGVWELAGNAGKNLLDAGHDSDLFQKT